VKSNPSNSYQFLSADLKLKILFVSYKQTWPTIVSLDRQMRCVEKHELKTMRAHSQDYQTHAIAQDLTQAPANFLDW